MNAASVVTEGIPEWVNVVAFAAAAIGVVLIVVLNVRRMRTPPKSGEDEKDQPRL